MRRTTIFLTDELHERLRRDAFRQKISMAELIRLKLQPPVRQSKRRTASEDPILKVAGICQTGPILSESIDETLYGR